MLIVAGQSNATGYLSDAVDRSSGVDYFSARYANEADRRSTIAWDQTFVVPARTRRPVPLNTPQVRHGTNVRIFGPELSLARTIFSGTAQAVTVVKAGFGGQAISDWDPAKPGGLFDRLVSLVRATSARDARSGWHDTIGAIFWYQGEADALSSSAAAEYQMKLVKLIKAFRSRLPITPSTPIVLVKQSTPGRPGDSTVRAADDWAAANLAHVLTVDTLGLPRAEDGLHLTNEAELELGRRLAVAI